MRNEEAIDIIKCLAWHTRPNEEDIEQAIQALEQESCDECVSRQAVEDAIENMTVNGERLGYMVAYEILSDLPCVTPQPNIGHWIMEQSGLTGWKSISNCNCSECGASALLEFVSDMDGVSYTLKPSKYCPNCGAKMESGIV